MDDRERAKPRRKAYFRMIGESLDQQVPESEIISDLFAAGLSYGGISYPQARAAVRLIVEAGSERWVFYRLEDSAPPAKIIEELVAAGYERYEAEDFLFKIADLWVSIRHANERASWEGAEEDARRAFIGCWIVVALIVYFLFWM